MSQDMQLARWRPRRNDGVISSRSPKYVSMAEVPIWVWVQRQEKTNVPPQRQLGRESKLSFTQLFILLRSPMIRWGLSTLGRAICCALSTDSNVNLSRNTFTDTSRIIFNQISGYPVAQSSWHIKLTITNHFLITHR